MLNKILNVKDLVRTMLISFPETRDNDRLLLLKVWAHENPSLRSDNFPFNAFGRDFKIGDYAEPESVRRTRQKIQEAEPALRGRNYGIRKSHETVVRAEMRK
jgi:hypothetical protein